MVCHTDSRDSIADGGPKWSGYSVTESTGLSCQLEIVGGFLDDLLPAR